MSDPDATGLSMDSVKKQCCVWSRFFLVRTDELGIGYQVNLTRDSPGTSKERNYGIHYKSSESTVFLCSYCDEKDLIFYIKS